MEIHVEQVPGAQTALLRQQILRPHQSLAELTATMDTNPEAVYFGALVDGQIVGAGSVGPERPPWETDEARCWRLRGMATAADLRGQGVGRAVLAAIVDHVARRGGGLLWCSARTPAISLYERAGFVVVGEPWVDPDIGPHVHMEATVRGLTP